MDAAATAATSFSALPAVDAAATAATSSPSSFLAAAASSTAASPALAPWQCSHLPMGLDPGLHAALRAFAGYYRPYLAPAAIARVYADDMVTMLLLPGSLPGSTPP